MVYVATYNISYTLLGKCILLIMIGCTVTRIFTRQVLTALWGEPDVIMQLQFHMLVMRITRKGGCVTYCEITELLLLSDCMFPTSDMHIRMTVFVKQWRVITKFKF